MICKPFLCPKCAHYREMGMDIDMVLEEEEKMRQKKADKRAGRMRRKTQRAITRRAAAATR